MGGVIHESNLTGERRVLGLFIYLLLSVDLPNNLLFRPLTNHTYCCSSTCSQCSPAKGEELSKSAMADKPKLYGLPMSTNTARVIALLNEKEVEYELIPVDLRVGAHKQQPFISINPFGQLPAFVDGDVKLFESRAINKYLAYKHKDSGLDLLHLGNLKEYADVNLWLEIEAHQYSPPISELVYQILICPLFGGTTNQESVDANTAKLAKVLDIYEERLKHSKYLAGDFFSLADLHHLPYTFNLMATPKAELITSRPHVSAWWQDISSRPAWVKTAAGMRYA